MAKSLHRPARNAFRPAVRALLATLPAVVAVFGARASAPRPAQQPTGEIVANLAAGRVAVLVAKDGIAVATAQSQIEPQTLPPLIVPLGSLRVGVLLGPAEWVSPSVGRPPLRLDAELARIGPMRASVNADAAAMAATDIENIGLNFLEPLRTVAARLHGPLQLQSQEWFTELMLVDYAPDYGPEVWSLRYRADQMLLRDDFYRTSIHRPEYVQLYPPDKGQPKTLIESTYPPHDPGEPPILDLLKSGDSRLAALRSADPGIGRAAELLLRGESRKIRIEDGLDLLSAAFQAVSPKGAKQMILEITEKDGMKWVLGENEVAAPSPGQQSQQGAPTLRKKPGPGR